MNGYIKLHRSLLDNPVVMKDADHFAVWVYMLLKATFSEVDVLFKGKRRKLKRGQFTTGRKMIASDLGISESKVQRILAAFEEENQIRQETDYQCRLVEIVNWDKYQRGEVNNPFDGFSEKMQKSEQRFEQRKIYGNPCDTTGSEGQLSKSEQRFEQRVNNDRTTSEQRVNTKEERKEREKRNNVK